MKNPALTHWMLQPDGLASRLRALRVTAGMTGKELAHATGWQPSKVSRLENGKQVPTADDIRTWTRACQADNQATDELIELLGDAQSVRLAWKQRLHEGQAAVQAGYRNLVQESRSIRYFETTWIPGILQVPAYIRRVLSEMAELHGFAIDNIDAAVTQRIERQQHLYDTTKQFEFLLAEPVLHWLICPPDVMASQLDRLQTVIDMPNVRFGVLPFGTQLATTPQNAFQVYDDTAIVETFVGETTHDPETSAAYTRAIDRLWNEALTGNNARTRIVKAANGLRNQLKEEVT